ncbi:DNA-binding protein [bacterium]|nr:MAG: DNA-binding protein [bacterium]
MQPSSDLPPGLAQPALRALAAAGIARLEQLASFREAEVAHLHGIGPNALRLLRSALAERGLAFKQ